MSPFHFHPLWTLIFWVSYLSWFGFEMWVWSRDRRAAQGQKRDRGSLFAVFGAVFFGLFCIFDFPWWAPFARLPFAPAPTFVVAMLLVWIGMAFRLWAILTLGKFFRYTVFVQDEHRLVTSGPYRVLRHPSYTGALMTLTGIALAMHNWLSLITGIGFLLLGYTWRIRVEEIALEAQFGEMFRQNRARTWAVIPYVW